MKWWGVVNPSAGRGTLLDRVRAALGQRGIEADLHVSESASDLRSLVRHALGEGRQRLLVVGGDGTVNLAVNEVMEQGASVTLGVLPAGSGCDLVRTFAIPQDIEGAAHHLEGTATYAIDIGYVDGPWGRRFFANEVTMGLGAAVVRLAERLPARLGSARYSIAVWPALAAFRRSNVRITGGRRPIEEEASLIVLANGQFFGGGMNVAPKASMVDGDLDIQVFTGPKRNVVVLQPRVRRGTHLTHRAVRRFVAPAVEVAVARSWEVEADGEYLGETSSITAGVVSEAIRLKI